MAISRVGKQLFGAAIGMTLATVLYVGLEQLSLTSTGMKAYLVSPGQNIADSVGQVRVNDTTADSTTIGRLSRLANSVAQNFKQTEGLSSPLAGTAMNDRVQARKEARIVDAGQISAIENAVVYPNVVTEVTQRERIALRAARAVADHAGAPVYVSNPNVIEVPPSATKTSETKDFKGFKPVEMVTPPQTLPPSQVSAVSASSTPAHVASPTAVASPTVSATVSAKEVPVPAFTTAPAPSTPSVIAPPPSKDLPNSGVGIQLLVLLSLAISFALIRPDLSSRLIASLRHSS